MTPAHSRRGLRTLCGLSWLAAEWSPTLAGNEGRVSCPECLTQRKRTMASEQVYVEIFNIKSKEIAECMGPMDLRKAEKVAAGASINMGEDWSVRIVDEPTKVPA